MTHDEATLRDMVPHVKYEIEELRNGFSDWHTNATNAKNATIEQALLHFRVLREFFLTPTNKARHDDVVAAHYIANWAPQSKPVFEQTKGEIDKRLAHLSTHRLGCKEDWPIGDMNSAIEELIETFVNNLPRESKTWFSLPTPATAIVVGEVAIGTPTVTKYGAPFSSVFHT